MTTQITEFNSEIHEKLKSYVYRLVDPRNGKTFYVGKGKGNRVFDHANAVNPKEFYAENPDFEPTEDNKDPAKIEMILEIKDKGLDVIHIIQRWGMSDSTAFEVEAAFIDYFGLEHLTNKQKGHDYERGMRWTDDLNRELSAEPFKDYHENPECPKFILIKITDYSINLHKDKETEKERIYQAVRASWRITPKIANQYPHVLAVRHGIVVGVYQINENGWQKDSNDTTGKRAFFDGIPAEEKVKNYFMGKKIPERYIKRQNPVSYCDRNLVEAEEKK